jgi:hypothetical protein
VIPRSRLWPVRLRNHIIPKWGDVDWIDGKLTVERSVVCQNVDDVKTAESRKLVIDRVLLAAFRHRSKQPSASPALPNGRRQTFDFVHI